jgi:peptidoglycan biosynthesis protein MviN/MurJ (putative lipid II flippase)
MLLNLGLAALLVGPMELKGLALALSLTTTAEFAALFFLIGRRIPGFVDRTLYDGLRRMVVATVVLVMFTVLPFVFLDSLIGFSPEESIEALVILLASSASGGLAYFFMSFVLGLEEPRLVLACLPLPGLRARSVQT